MHVRYPHTLLLDQVSYLFYTTFLKMNYLHICSFRLDKEVANSNPQRSFRLFLTIDFGIPGENLASEHKLEIAV